MRTLQVHVKPNSKAPGLESQPDGSLLARVRAPPTEGRANEELIALIAAHFGVPKSRVAIRRGASGRRKWVEVDD